MMIFKRAADLIYTFRFLKLLTTRFEDTAAHKLGIIDFRGVRNRNVEIDTPEKKDAYTPFHRLVFNLKRIISKNGSEKFASYASALYLVKENYYVDVDKILKASDIDLKMFVNENSQWFVLENEALAPGVYRLKTDKILNDNFEMKAFEKDQVKVHPNSFPIGEILGVNIYEATHLKTNKAIYVSVGELYK